MVPPVKGQQENPTIAQRRSDHFTCFNRYIDRSGNSLFPFISSDQERLFFLPQKKEANESIANKNILVTGVIHKSNIQSQITNTK